MSLRAKSKNLIPKRNTHCRIDDRCRRTPLKTKTPPPTSGQKTYLSRYHPKLRQLPYLFSRANGRIPSQLTCLSAKITTGDHASYLLSGLSPSPARFVKVLRTLCPAQPPCGRSIHISPYYKASPLFCKASFSS